MKAVNIHDAPKCLNTNDKVFWVLGYDDAVEAYEAEIAELRAELAGLKADAARYRWIVGNIVLNDFENLEEVFAVFGDSDACTKEEFDACINAAMKESK